jgi:hypothetical protein
LHGVVTDGLRLARAQIVVRDEPYLFAQSMSAHVASNTIQIRPQRPARLVVSVEPLHERQEDFLSHVFSCSRRPRHRPRKPVDAQVMALIERREGVPIAGRCGNDQFTVGLLRPRPGHLQRIATSHGQSSEILWDGKDDSGRSAMDFVGNCQPVLTKG